MFQIKLPDWIKVNEDTKEKVSLTIDTETAYDLYLQKYNFKEVDQFALEVVRRCLTEDLKKIFNKPMHLTLNRCEKYKLSEYKPGKGEAAANLEWKKFYKPMPKTAVA